MPIMCEECKCSIYLEDKSDGTRDYAGCENGCECCNSPEEEGKVYTVTLRLDEEWLKILAKVASDPHEGEVLQWVSVEEEGQAN